jgi:hypothetical protein
MTVAELGQRDDGPPRHAIGLAKLLSALRILMDGGRQPVQAIELVEVNFASFSADEIGDADIARPDLFVRVTTAPNALVHYHQLMPCLQIAHERSDKEDVLRAA